jgi:ABC-2 type transport system permease protein
MIRLLRIARREYLAYVRTFGFWLSMGMVPVSIAVFGVGPTLVARSTPPPAVAVIDLTAQGYGAAVEKAFTRPKTATGDWESNGVVVPSPIAPPASPAAAGQALKPWLLGERLLPAEGGAKPQKLGVAAVIHPVGNGQVSVDFWSSNLAQQSAKDVINRAVDDHFQDLKLKAAGLAPDTIAALSDGAPDVVDYSPKAEASGKASLKDHLPGFVGFGLAMLLWMLIFTGAGLLLNSVIEEKSSRILEVLLSSASVPEIMFGKILGVAGIALTVLAVWLGLAGVILAFTNPALAGDIAAVILGKGMVFYFAIYLIGGYLMYASVFTAVGAFCETTREAQTLLGPIMMLLAIPIVFLTQAITNPDAPILRILSWIPLFTPFLMTARAAVEPPLWEVAGTGLLMLATVALVVWIAGRAFRAGALSTGKVDLKGLLAKLRLAD